jgi:uncharacterized protein (DUF924 family)
MGCKLASHERVAAILGFWFGDRDEARKEWYAADPAFDAALRARFLVDEAAAAAGRLDPWMAERDPCLALILLLDQVPRNIHRGTPTAFASDARARAVADHAIARGFDQALSPVRRAFVYLPFMHSEALADQERCVALHAAMEPDGGPDSGLDFARRHRAIIARFGRFPHRNAILGRQSKEEETAFLAEPESGF